jgi:hypothetical protein
VMISVCLRLEYVISISDGIRWTQRGPMAMKWNGRSRKVANSSVSKTFTWKMTVAEGCERYRYFFPAGTGAAAHSSFEVNGMT